MHVQLKIFPFCEDTTAGFGQLKRAVHAFLFLELLGGSFTRGSAAEVPLVAAPRNACLRVTIAGGGMLDPYIFVADRVCGCES